jgi:uncharacterized protein YeaO (DUF488 family)
MIRLKRAYEPPDENDGMRILVDRLWPRGMSKEKAKIDLWLKDAAPSAELRTWFGHDPSRWNGFRTRFFRELEKQPEAVARLINEAKRGTVTLVYGAKDMEHNNAIAVREFLESKQPQK